MPDDQLPARLDVESFGHDLAQIRRALNIPQDKLAAAAGISRVQLQNIEHGLSDRAKRTPANPKFQTVISICHALGVNFRLDFSEPTLVRVVFDFEPRTGGR